MISDWLANCSVGQWTPFEAATALKEALRKEGYSISDGTQPQYLTDCIHPRKSACPKYGMCLSSICKNAGKLIVTRVCVEDKKPGDLTVPYERWM